MDAAFKSHVRDFLLLKQGSGLCAALPLITEKRIIKFSPRETILLSLSG